MRVLRPDSSKISKKVSILIPMRNEEKNVTPVVTSVIDSKNLEHCEILVLDDGSEDATLAQLNSFTGAITVIQGRALPMDWMGKPYACHQLSEKSDGDYLVFLDADVRPSSEAICSAINLMESLSWDFLSPYPAQSAPTLLMKLIQPLLQWSWFASVPLRFAESGRINSMIVANGQFFLVKASAYENIGGHSSVKAEVLEDLCLARALSRAGYKGGVADASALIRCSMYEQNSEMINGYTKSLWKAFGGTLGTLVTIFVLISSQILPAILLLLGNNWALLPFLMASITHLASSLKTRSWPVNALMHPISLTVLILLIAESIRRKAIGRLEWRGRRVI